jgi:hypothetical protein
MHLELSSFPFFRDVATSYFVFGTAGSFAMLLPILKPASLYGRLLASAPPPPSAALRALQALALPKSTCFTLFYACGFIIAGAVFAGALLGHLPPAHACVLGAFLLHVARRLYECLAVHRFSASARMPLHLFLFGAAHYVCAPFALLPACVGAPPAPRAPLAALGALLFAAGSALQHVAHCALAALPRGRGGGEEGSSRKVYPLPSSERSAVFALALCPHYTGEILLYVGLLLLREAAAGGCAETGWGAREGWGGSPAWGAHAHWALLAWTTTNLCVTGSRTKAGYVADFPGEPRAKTTAAVIPGLL